MIQQRESVYVGQLGPIPLYVHWSALLLVYMAYRWSSNGSRFDVPEFIILLMVLVLGIVLHELGHGLTAKALGAFGITITLWAFGGLCRSTRDSLPRRELLIVAAGPAVSFILAGLGYLAVAWLKDGAHDDLLYNGSGDPSLLYKFAAATYAVNLLMGIFNSLPIYPLDGGQIVYQLVQVTTGRQLLARQVSLTLAVFGALAFIGYQVHQNGDRFDEGMIYTVALMGWLVFNAFRYLR